MAEPVTYATVPPPKPKISRDRTAVVLAVVAAAPVLVDRPLSWIQGRLNDPWWPLGYTPTQCLSCMVPLIFLAVAAWLLLRVVTRFMDGTAMQRVRWLLLIVLAASPFWDHALPTSPFWWLGNYTRGFVSWTRANVDAKAIRQWCATVPITPGEHADRDFGLAFAARPGRYKGIPVQAYWPSNLIKPTPQRVYVLADRSAIVLEWGSGSHFDWNRTVFILASEDAHPVDPWLLDVGHGVWVFVEGPS